MQIEALSRTSRQGMALPTMVDGDGGFAAAMAAVGSSNDARAVSLVQGLPGGTYDFGRISAREFATVARSLVDERKVGASALDGASAMVAGADPDQRLNMLALLHADATANEKAPGGMTAAFTQKAALAVMVRLHREWNVPVTLVEPDAAVTPAMTAEAANAKLAIAIDAFRKEAELTPTQRLAKRLRAEVMKDMKVSEDALNAMPPADRALLEKRIADEVARRMAMLGFAAATNTRAQDGDEARKAMAAADRSG